MRGEQPRVIILRHGLLLFNRFEIDFFEVERFNQELRKLSESEYDWSRYRGASGLDAHPHPITVNEQGRLLSKSQVRSRSLWRPPGAPRS